MIEVTEKELTKMRLGKKMVGTLEKKQPPAKKELDANIKATQELAVAIKALAEKEQPTPQDMTPLFETIIKIQDTQKEVIALLAEKAKPKVWEFAIKRDRNDKMTKILAKERD